LDVGIVRHRGRSARAVLRGVRAFVAIWVACAAPAAGQDATWNANPGSSDFFTAANWTPTAVPTGFATFGNSSITTLTFSGSRNIDGFVFDAGAPAYTFNLTSGFGLRFHTDGIINNSSNAPTFNVNNSLLQFDDTSSAGNAIINLTGGTVDFLGSSTAGSAQLEASPGTTFDFSGTLGPGNLGAITAGSISGAGNFNLGGNTLTVGSNDLSTEVTGFISGNALVKVGSGTLTLSNANTYGGGTTISGGTIVANHVDGGTGIIDALGPGNITLDGGTLRATVSGSFLNLITFNDDKTSVLSAGSQTVSIDGGLFLGSNAVAQFGVAGDTGTIIVNTAPSADTTNKVVVAGGTLKDSNDTLVGLTYFASTQVNAGATLDFNDSGNQAIRNLTGAGNVVTGTSSSSFLTLFVDDNTSSTFGGVISGAGHVMIMSYTSADGTMIFTGANNYTGGTTVCFCSTLQLGTLEAAGGVVGNVIVEGTLNVVNSDTSVITLIRIDGGTAQFFNGTSAGTATIVNHFGGFLNFFDTSTAGSADITNRDGGLTTFANSSTAGNATITNRVTFGETDFRNTSNAGHATITNNGGLTNFFDQSSAANADITNRNGGATIFGDFYGGGSDTATAGNATITNRATGGATLFFGMTTAGAATITNNGGVTSFFEQSNAGTATIINRNGGLTIFSDTSSAASATIVNRDGLIFSPSFTVFTSSSTAGAATITNQDLGATQFVDNASAGNASITNNAFGTTVFGTFGDAPTAANATITTNADGTMQFAALSTAGNATITTNSGGVVGFFDNSTGGDARFVTNAGGTVDFSQTAGPAGDKRVTAGSIAGAGDYYLGGVELTVGSNNLSTVVDGIIHDGVSPALSGCPCIIPGSGASLIKVGTGTLTLAGINAYTGPTVVNAGILSVNGSIVSSSGVTVNAAGTLGGTGNVPSVTINGGTLAPGNSVGTITVNGSLTFVGAGNYLVEVSPAAADRTNVTGAATLTGTLAAVFQPGVFLPGTSYVVLSTTGGRSGSFDTFTTSGVPAALGVSVSYTPTDVILNLSSAVAQVSGLNVNQRAVATTLDAVFNGGVGVPPIFANLYGLAAAAIPGALTQLSGEIGTAAPTAAFQTTDQFLQLMLDPFLETRLGDGTVQGRAFAFAPESSVQAAMPAELLAYNSIVTKAPPMVAPDRRFTVWGAAYGASGRFSGDSSIGSNSINISNGSFAAGIDYRAWRDTTFGLAVAGGRYTYGIDGLGSGRGDAVQAGLYGSTRFAGNAYLSAALSYGHHDLSTDRTVAFGAAFDRLSADFAGTTWGGRIETGYRFALAHGFGVTPFAAAQAQRFETSAYAERDLLGLGPAGFALNYAARSAEETRSELGARFDYRTLIGGALLTLRARAAWGHEFSTDRSIAASFQALPGFGFTVIGAAQAPNVALVSGGAELKLRNGVALRAKFDGELSGRSNVYAGSGGLYVTW
jgi:autotransporter-associated beta strand protein